MGNIYKNPCFIPIIMILLFSEAIKMNDKINSLDFFRENLRLTANTFPIEVNMAFYNGPKWVEPGASYDIIKASLESGLTWRVLINTPEVANTFSQYKSEIVRENWIKLAEKYPHELLVRECKIPFLHIYHAIKTFDETANKESAKSHIKFFAYDKEGILIPAGDEVYESGSEGYEIYDNEFEFLWENAIPIL